ncbi:peptidoglycan-binding protein [Streptomyces chartreusis]|jgi:transcriptional regulator with XRE-family HTH domain|uniref:peptidoglycan-binding protein n=1 Tax=Streptomyces chartreusis TaxID=1969 RepID=UPI00380E4324|nr:peptidoglycan-binding protein [Streptomyces chartreusis]WTA29308.1 peptidoglycan-binding protein [Streptomyces chartreusis]
MSRWAALPAELDPRVRQLVVRLRRLKDHSGLSLRQLAARTGYSQKSWERYLGGRSLPPREAVEGLARAVDEEPTRLLALHEVAAEAWRNGRREASAGEPEREREPLVAPESLSAEATGPRSPGRSLRVALVAGAVALVLALSTAVLLVVRLSGGDPAQPASPLVVTGGQSSPAVSESMPPSASASPSAPAYTCRSERVDGHWYAGLSRTRDAILANGHAGPEVAEAQCLLRRAGISPGAVDGIFGPVTERAVRQVQRRAGLVVDGIIGPHTWKALRQ